MRNIKPDPLPEDIKAAEQRFWAKVTKTEACWLWNAPSDPNRRGSISIGGVPYLAPRISWIMHNGAIPAGLYVLHKCDVPACVRPDHLFVGTHQDNAVDCATKGRMWLQQNPDMALRGTKSPNAKLTEEMVRYAHEQNRLGRPHWAVAKELGVRRTTLQDALHGKTWAHVKVERPAEEPAPANCPVKVGQIWRENDKRFNRSVRILAVTATHAFIQPTWGGRKTKAALWRFNGKLSGYYLTDDPTAAPTNPEPLWRRGTLSSPSPSNPPDRTTG